MENTLEPMIKLEANPKEGSVPVLSYNVPEPTSYTGQNIIELDLIPQGQNPQTYFKPDCVNIIHLAPEKEPVAAAAAKATPVLDRIRKQPIPIRQISDKLGKLVAEKAWDKARLTYAAMSLDLIKEKLVSDLKTGNTELINLNVCGSMVINQFIGVETGQLKQTPRQILQIRKLWPTLPNSDTMLSLDYAAQEVQKGNRIVAIKQLTGRITVDISPRGFIDEIDLLKIIPGGGEKPIIETLVIAPRIMLVETYKLSSFTGSYGAGRTINTFSLLPGEKSKISIRTYARSEETKNEASSIFDSFTEDCVNEFGASVISEMADQKSTSSLFEYDEKVSDVSQEASSNLSVSVKGSASLGFFKAKANASVTSSYSSSSNEHASSSSASGATHTARNEFAKNIQNATSKHANTASNRRDVQVNTSSQVKQTNEEETEIVREIENINKSRTLNFVFRQMNQEYISILHLKDIRIAFFHGNGNYLGAYTLPELDKLLETYVQPTKQAEVRKAILHELLNITDYQDNQPKGYDRNGNDVSKPFIQSRVFLDEKNKQIGEPYYQFSKDQYSKYVDQNGREILVEGIITAVNKNVLRTDGIIVDTILGQGVAIDSYTTNKQEEEVREMKLKNDLMAAEIAKQKYLYSLLENGNHPEKAKLVEYLYLTSGKTRKSIENSTPE